MKFLHSMIRVKDLDKALHFFVNLLGLKISRRKDYEQGRFSLVFLSDSYSDVEIELTYNWDQEADYTNGRNFGHLAFLVDDIYEICEKLEANGVQILRPPRDGHMAFVKTPDEISIELLQKGNPLSPQEPWKSRENIGTW